MEQQLDFNDVTIVSVFPFPLLEDKPGLTPRFYQIPAAQDDDITLTVIKPAIGWIEIPERNERIRADITPASVANSIVRDFCASQLCYDSNASPGFLILPGAETNKDKVKDKFAAQIKAIREKQNNWFRKLVRMADDDWAKWHQYRMISDLQRVAAKRLLLDREWLSDVTPDKKACPACFEIINIGAAVCSHCHAIVDKEKFKKFEFAGSPTK